MTAKTLPLKPARTALIVLGMHRSGTSALAGSLSHLGADLPQDLMEAADQNPKGFFESNRISYLNEDLLISAGRRFFSYEPVPEQWFASPKAAEFHERALEALHEDFGRSHLFVLKDPRICRLLPFWHRVLQDAGCRPLHVCTHRHPLDVAASMNRVSAYETDYAVHLWLRHVLEAEAASRGHPRAFTSFDSLMTDPVEALTQIGASLSLAWPRSPASARAELGDFLSEDLRHFRQTATRGVGQDDMPSWIAETLAILNRWVAKGEQPGDYSELDRIHAAVLASAPVLQGPLWQNQEKRWRFSELQNALDAAQAKAEQETIAHDKLRQERDDLASRCDQLESNLAQRRTENADLHRKIETDAQTIATLEAARDALQADHAKLLDQLNRNTTRMTQMTEQFALQMEQALDVRLQQTASWNVERAQFQTQLAERTRQQAEITQHAAALEAARQDLEYRLAAVYDSTSWRLTGPLRRIVQAFRRG